MRIGIDIDGTLTNETIGWDYSKRTPRQDVIDKVNQHYDQGDFITLFSSRFQSDRKVTVAWLRKHGVKYNRLILGKPKFDWYIDDINSSPTEFITYYVKKAKVSK